MEFDLFFFIGVSITVYVQRKGKDLKALEPVVTFTQSLSLLSCQCASHLTVPIYFPKYALLVIKHRIYGLSQRKFRGNGMREEMKPDSEAFRALRRADERTGIYLCIPLSGIRVLGFKTGLFAEAVHL